MGKNAKSLWFIALNTLTVLACFGHYKDISSKLMSLISNDIHLRCLIIQPLMCFAEIFDLPSVQTLFDAVKCHFESFADSASSSTLVLWKFFVVPEDTEAKWKRQDARRLASIKCLHQNVISVDRINISHPLLSNFFWIPFDFDVLHRWMLRILRSPWSFTLPFICILKNKSKKSKNYTFWTLSCDCF